MKNSINNCNNFISCRDTNGKQVIHLKSDNTEIMTYDNTNEV